MSIGLVGQSGEPQLAVATEQVARRLGVSRSMVYQLVRRQELRPFKIGRRTLFKVTEIEAWLERQPTDALAT